MNRRYTLTVWLTRPMDEDCERWADQTPKEQHNENRAVEKEILHVLRRVEGDADVEIMETADVTDEGNTA